VAGFGAIENQISPSPADRVRGCADQQKMTDREHLKKQMFRTSQLFFIDGN